jgi:hypothetical protein
MDAQRSHRQHARGNVVPLRTRARKGAPRAARPAPRPRKFDAFTAAHQAARLEHIAFQVGALRAELQAGGLWTPDGALDRLARIMGALETEAALIEAGPEPTEGAA